MTHRLCLALGTLTLALATPGCLSEEPTTSDTEAELGLSGDGRYDVARFYWAAYEDEPYIYKGCPEPGPQPWRDRARIAVPRGTDVVEVELGTAVPLEIRALDVPRGLDLRAHDRGVTISVGDPFVGDPIPWSILVNNEKCSYELHAELAFE